MVIVITSGIIGVLLPAKTENLNVMIRETSTSGKVYPAYLWLFSNPVVQAANEPLRYEFEMTTLPFLPRFGVSIANSL